MIISGTDYRLLFLYHYVHDPCGSSDWIHTRLIYKTSHFLGVVVDGTIVGNNPSGGRELSLNFLYKTLYTLFCEKIRTTNVY